jgi:hypothetical protein
MNVESSQHTRHAAESAQARGANDHPRKTIEPIWTRSRVTFGELFTPRASVVGGRSSATPAPKPGKPSKPAVGADSTPVGTARCVAPAAVEPSIVPVRAPMAISTPASAQAVLASNEPQPAPSMISSPTDVGAGSFGASRSADCVVVSGDPSDRWLGLGAIRDSSDRLTIESIAGDNAATDSPAPSMTGAAAAPMIAPDATDPNPGGGGRAIDPDAWDRLVEYAQVVRESESDASVRLALGREVHGGLAMEIRSTGDGRITLHVVSPTGSLPGDHASVESLRRALASRDLDAAMIVE